MHRRDLLTLTGSVTGGMLAGCLGSQSPDGPSTDTPIDTPAETPGSAEEGPTRWERTFEDEPTRPGVDPLVYTGAENTAYGIDPMSGEEVWTRTLDNPVRWVYTHDDVVYLTSSPENNLHSPATVDALTATTGEHRWSFELDKQASIFARGEGLVVVKTSDDVANGRERVFAFESTDGNKRWERELFEPKSAALSDGVLFVVSDKRLQALDVKSGDVRWRHSLDSYQFDSLTVGSQTVTVVNEPEPDETELITLDRSGRERWTFDEWVPTGPTIHEGRLFTGGEYVAAFDATSGDLEWQSEQGGFLYHAPVVDGKLVAGGDAVRAYAVDDGTERWSYSPDPELVVPEGVRNGTTYVHTSVSNDDGKRHAYGVDIDDGTELWRLSTGTKQSDLAIGRQGAYVTEKAGTLYALS